MASVNAKLRDLRLKNPSDDDLKEIKRQIVNETNDRGAAILATTLVENSLSWAISRHILNIPTMYGNIFDNDGPLSSLDARIRVARAIGITGPVTHGNLDTIKHIRNTFAHARIPVTFLTDEIKQACDVLKRDDGEPDSYKSYRNRFITYCYMTSDQLSRYASRCLFYRAEIVERSKMVFVPPESLR